MTYRRLLVVAVLLLALMGSGMIASAPQEPMMYRFNDGRIMSDILSAVDEVRTDFHLPPVTVLTGRFEDSDTMALTMARPTLPIEQRYVIIFNSLYTANPALMTKVVDIDVAAGYHAGGCSPGRMLAYHEMGHVIDGIHNRQPRALVRQRYGEDNLPGLTGYSYDFWGELNPPEALAEAFASVKCQGTRAQPGEQLLYTILTGRQP